MGRFRPQGLKLGVEDPSTVFAIFLSDGQLLSFMAIICAGCSIRGLALLSILWTGGRECHSP